MSTIAIKFAVIVSLLTVTLFSLGPQLGSIDIDGDGVPDVPVMVMVRGINQQVQSAQTDKHTRIVLAKVSPFSELTSDDPGLTKGRISRDLGSTGLDPTTPLRC